MKTRSRCYFTGTVKVEFHLPDFPNALLTSYRDYVLCVYSLWEMMDGTVVGNNLPSNNALY